jgi:hypothetical protein
MPRLLALVAATVLVACGARGVTSEASVLPSASPAPLATTTRTPPSRAPSPSLFPASAVTVTVNGTRYSGGEVARAQRDVPIVVELAFPFDVDRASVDTYIPRDAANAWPDARTARLTFPANTDIQFKIPEARAATGDEHVALLVVIVSYPPAHIVAIATLAEIAANKKIPVPTARTITVPDGDGTTVSPDGRRALVFDGFGPGTGPQPTLVDLATGALSVLAAPPASDGWFSFAGWLPDGRLVLVGRHVWAGDGDGRSMRQLADAVGAVNGYPWLAVPDPAGTRIALWGYNADGHIAVIRLDDGSVRKISGPFRRSCADCGITLAWSSDGKLIAGTDADSETGSAQTRVRVIDVAADRTTRTLEGNVYSIVGLPTNELMTIRDSGESGAGARLLGLRTGFDLVERRHYLGCGWNMSPDGRYLLEAVCSGGAGYPTWTVTDTSTSTTISFYVEASKSNGVSGALHWLADDRLAAY